MYNPAFLTIVTTLYIRSPEHTHLVFRSLYLLNAKFLRKFLPLLLLPYIESEMIIKKKKKVEEEEKEEEKLIN